MNANLTVRPATEADRTAILAIARPLVESADTYAFDPDISDDALFRYWVPKTDGAGFVCEAQGQIAGIFVIRCNQPGPGDHIANASFAVAEHARGQGIGRFMGETALARAHGMGFRAMQFNIVIASNAPAIALWQRLGFQIIGTIPDGFRRTDGGYDDFHIMHKSLQEAPNADHAPSGAA